MRRVRLGHLRGKEWRMRLWHVLGVTCVRPRPLHWGGRVCRLGSRLGMQHSCWRWRSGCHEWHCWRAMPHWAGGCGGRGKLAPTTVEVGLLADGGAAEPLCLGQKACTRCRLLRVAILRWSRCVLRRSGDCGRGHSGDCGRGHTRWPAGKTHTHHCMHMHMLVGCGGLLERQHPATKLPSYHACTCTCTCSCTCTGTCLGLTLAPEWL